MILCASQVIVNGPRYALSKDHEITVHRVRRGKMLRIERCGRNCGRAGFLGSRSSTVRAVVTEVSEPALVAAFDKGGAERVTRLYWRDDLTEDQCWLGAPGPCLGYR
jgi:hypothetical protein